jgi:hypothetical protein
VTKEKHFHILDAPSLLLAPYVGQEIRVTGFDYDGVISVTKAEVMKVWQWEEIDIKSLIPGVVPNRVEGTRECIQLKSASENS